MNWIFSLFPVVLFSLSAAAAALPPLKRITLPRVARSSEAVFVARVATLNAESGPCSLTVTYEVEEVLKGDPQQVGMGVTDAFPPAGILPGCETATSSARLGSRFDGPPSPGTRVVVMSGSEAGTVYLPGTRVGDVRQWLTRSLNLPWNMNYVMR